MLKLLVSLLAMEIALLAVLRPVILWYLGLTRMMKALESIDASLKCLPAVRTEAARIRRAG